MIFFLALLSATQPPAMVTITIKEGREMIGLPKQEVVYRGMCDGRPASAVVRRATLTEPGRLVLRAGGWERAVPESFLRGAALTTALHSIGLGCDGHSLQVHGLAISQNAQGELILEVQNAILDLRKGGLSLTKLTSWSPADTREELRPRRHVRPDGRP